LTRHVNRSALVGRLRCRFKIIIIIIMPTISQLARVLQCTESQVRAQFQKNLSSMREDLARANRTGRPVRGYSAERIAMDIAEMESRLSK
jgi:hypothetical protein